MCNCGKNPALKVNPSFYASRPGGSASAGARPRASPFIGSGQRRATPVPAVARTAARPITHAAAPAPIPKPMPTPAKPHTRARPITTTTSPHPRKKALPLFEDSKQTKAVKPRRTIYGFVRR